MYLVELRPGREELYRTGDDLAAAIRRGDVDVHSRIYHRATSKWISITLHPQYKAIVAQTTAQKAAEVLPPLDRSSWTYLNAQSETLEGSQPDGPDAETGGAPAAERVSQPWRRLFALSVAGLALLLGIQLAFAGPRPPWAASGPGRSPVTPAATHGDEEVGDEQVISLASTSAGWSDDDDLDDDPKPPAATRASAPAPPPLPRAPSLRLKTLGEVLPAGAERGRKGVPAEATVGGLIARYSAAHESARERLASGVRVARLGKLLAASRLTPDGGVTQTRLGLAGVANFIRVYRQQEELIEQEFQDSFAVMSKEHRWNTNALRQWQSRSEPREPAALAALSSRLLAGIDSVLGLLTEQAGAYRLGEGTIAFEDVGASRRYGRLRRQVSSLVDSAKVAGGEKSVGPMSYLLQAIGTTRLPREI
jgi:hypothetical protein